MLTAQQTTILAALVVAGFALAFIAWAVRVFRSKEFTVAQFPWFYPFSFIMTRVLWRAEVEGRLPKGGAIVVCNHIGPIDPAFIELATNRLVHWMVAREYCMQFGMRWFFRLMGVIPVGRGGIDTAATKMAIRLAQEGDLVGLFPEGKINTTDRLLLPGRPGAALIALKARVPVVPCYISGAPNDGTTYGFLFVPARTRLKVGKPIDISEYYDREDDREALDDLTKRLLREIAKLAGFDDYPATVAGRNWKHAQVPA